MKKELHILNNDDLSLIYGGWQLVPDLKIILTWDTDKELFIYPQGIRLNKEEREYMDHLDLYYDGRRVRHKSLSGPVVDNDEVVKLLLKAGFEEEEETRHYK